MMQLLSFEDVVIAGKTVYGEARGELWEGKLAVAYALVNRWRTTTGQFHRDDTLATACLRHTGTNVMCRLFGVEYKTRPE